MVRVKFQYIVRAVLAVSGFIFLTGCSGGPKSIDATRATGPDFATVSFIDGNATIMSGSVSRELSVGDQVGSKDTIITGTASLVELEFATLGRVVIQEKTTFRIESLVADGHRLVASDIAGVILAKVHKLAPGDSFIVKAPSAACGVRGTAFLVSVATDGTADFAVREGKVALFPNAAVDRGWLKTSTGSENILDIDHFPALETGTRLTVKPDDPALALLTSRLDNQPAIADAAKLDPDLEWLKLPAESIRDNESRMIDSVLDRPLPETSPLSSAVPAVTISGKIGATPLPRISGKSLAVSSGGNEMLPGDPDNSLVMIQAEPVSTAVDPSVIWDVAMPYSSGPVAGPAEKPMKVSQVMLKVDPSASARIDDLNGSINLTVSKVRGPGIENIPDISLDLVQTVALEKNSLYRLSFTAWADAPSRIVPAVREDDRDLNHDDFRWTDYKPYNTLYIGTEPRQYSETFANYIGNDPAARISFQVGNQAGTYHFQDINFFPMGIAPPRQSGNLVPNGNFDFGMLHWHIWEFGVTKGNASSQNGIFRYEPTKSGVEIWHSQLLSHQTINITKGKYYVVDFDAQSDQSCHLGFVLHESNRDLNKDGDKFSPHVKYLYLPVSRNWNHYHGRLKAISTDDRADVVFDLGNAAKTIRLDNIRIQEEP